MNAAAALVRMANKPRSLPRTTFEVRNARRLRFVSPRLKDGWSRACRLVVQAAHRIYIDDVAYNDSRGGFDRSFVFDGLADVAMGHPELSTDDLVRALRDALRFCGFE